MKNLSFIHKIGLFQKISFLVSFMLVISIAVSTAISIRKQTAIITRELIEKDKIVSQNLAASVKNAFWSLNWLFVEKQLQEITKLEDITFIDLIKPDGEIYMSAGDKICGENILTPELMSTQKQILEEVLCPATGEKIKLIITPVKVGDDRWILTTGFSLQQVEKAKESIIVDNVLLGIVIFLFGIIVSFFFTRGITMPAEQLAKGTREIGKGNLDYRINIKSHDEIGGLAVSFNNMAEALKKTTASRDSLAKEIKEQKQLEAQLQLAHKMEAIGILAGGVAHDLNNVLSGIVSYPELLLMKISEDSPLRKPLLTIQRSGLKAAAVVQDMLALARRGVSITEVVELNNIISEYLKSPEYQKLTSFHPYVKLETNLETNLLNIVGSSVHLSKTIMNLVSNASEAMPDEGTIFISTENRYLDRPVKGYDHVKEGDYVVFLISDTGTGISPDDIEKIFEPFYTKKKMGRSGTGLGMAVVWGTVKDHNGYIDVQSTQGEGTTVTLYLPATRNKPAEYESKLSIESYMGKGEKILVVDDIEEQRTIASSLLTKLNYSVITVSCGKEAVDYMRNNSADLMVLDMIMDPGIDGLETYRQILKIHPKQKAIIASGFSETDYVKEAQRLGAGAYVKKPYMLENIALAVKAELDKK